MTGSLGSCFSHYSFIINEFHYLAPHLTKHSYFVLFSSFGYFLLPANTFSPLLSIRLFARSSGDIPTHALFPELLAFKLGKESTQAESFVKISFFGLWFSFRPQSPIFALYVVFLEIPVPY